MEIIKKILIIGLLSFSLFGAELEWAEDYEVGLAQAKKEHKLVYIFISSTHCPWCSKFEREVLTNDAVIKDLEKDYVIIGLNKEMDDIPEGYSARVIPRHYFCESDGKVFYTFAGYYDSVDFLDTLKEIRDGRAEELEEEKAQKENK